jgi:hypothetical protein
MLVDELAPDATTTAAYIVSLMAGVRQSEAITWYSSILPSGIS